MRQNYDDTRQQVLTIGHRMMAARGFTSVGLNEILQTAGVPKGSFYHYFKSKEQYGQALLEDYFKAYLSMMDQLLLMSGETGRACLIGYFKAWAVRYREPLETDECLVVKLSAEVADLSEAMRITLRDGTQQIIERLEACISRGVEDGSLLAEDPGHLAQLLYHNWLGASLLNKLRRDGQPLDLAMKSTEALFGL